MTLSLLVYTMYFLKLACGILLTLYIKTQREVQFLPVTFIYGHMVILLNFYGLRCISPLFVQSLIYFSYSKDWGGGLCGENIPIY